MEDMFIKVQEVEKLKALLKILQEQKLNIDNSYVLELQKSHILN